VYKHFNILIIFNLQLNCVLCILTEVLINEYRIVSYLLGLCYSEDLKNYGFGPMLEKFVAKMNTLSETGFVGTFPVIGEQTVYAALCQVTCDNLALNGILHRVIFL